MTNLVYTRAQLESKKLSDLKAIALTWSAIATDKRSKESWISAILLAQPQSVKPLEEVKPVATCADCPRFQSHADATDKGWCCLFDRFAREHHTMTQDCINNIESLSQADYLFHESIEEEIEQPINLPHVGQTHFIGSTLLRCIEIGTDYAAVWDVINDGVTVGEIKMDWKCNWTHTLSFKLFAIPQEAIASLCESATELIETPEFEIYPTDTENVFSVASRKSGKYYQVCLDSGSCSCLHWKHRHGQDGFEDKHIDAVKVFLQSYSREQLCYQLIEKNSGIIASQ